MAERYSMDSNAVSDILRGREDVLRRMKDAVKSGHEVAICSIVFYEVERGLKAAGSSRKLREFYRLYESLPHLYLDRESMAAIGKASNIYVDLHKGRQIEDNDIYIAAIAMTNGYTLITDNAKHFSCIDGLRTENWRETKSRPADI